MAGPSLIPGAKRMFDEGFAVPNLGLIRGHSYESNVPYVLRFMIDNNIQGSDWIVVPKNTYSIRQPHKYTQHAHSSAFQPVDFIAPVAVENQMKISRCTIEIDVFYNQIQAQPCAGIYSSIAPLRILSFDIECQGRKGLYLYSSYSY